MNLAIKDLIGPRCIIQQDGQKIYEMIYEPLTKGISVTLDFREVTQFASPFFNFAIGQLLRDIKQEDLRKFLKIINLNNVGQHVVERVIENANEYQTDTNYQKIVEDILKQQSKESES